MNSEVPMTNMTDAESLANYQERINYHERRARTAMLIADEVTFWRELCRALSLTQAWIAEHGGAKK